MFIGARQKSGARSTASVCAKFVENSHRRIKGGIRIERKNNMKILLILAIAMAGGLALSRLMKLLNLPNVTGYLIAGILIGPFVLKLVTNGDIKSAKIITTTALGFIAFSIGGEFKLSLLKKLGGKIVVITVVQALMPVKLPGPISVVMSSMSSGVRPASFNILTMVEIKYAE